VIAVRNQAIVIVSEMEELRAEMNAKNQSEAKLKNRPRLRARISAK